MEMCNHQISRKDSQDHQPKPGSSDEETGVQRQRVPQAAPGPGLLSPQHTAQCGLVGSPQGLVILRQQGETPEGWPQE